MTGEHKEGEFEAIDQAKYEAISLGAILRELTAWVEAHGGSNACLEVRRDQSLEGTLRVSELRAANLVDVLSAYIHGEYLEGDSGNYVHDEEGHGVSIEP